MINKEQVLHILETQHFTDCDLRSITIMLNPNRHLGADRVLAQEVKKILDQLIAAGKIEQVKGKIGKRTYQFYKEVREK